MIEFLKQDDPLYKKVNKTGKKITIKHYLNFINPIIGIYKNKEVEIYPLYVRVTFNRQSTKIRSLLASTRISIEEFQEISGDTLLSIKREALHIMHIINENYKYELEENSDKANRKQFLSDILTGHFNHYDSLCECVNEALFERMRNANIDNGKISDFYVTGGQSGDFSASELLDYLSVTEPVWNRFKCEIGDVFRYFRLFYCEFVYENWHYHYFPINIADALYFDFKDKFLTFLQKKGYNVNLDFIDEAISINK